MSILTAISGAARVLTPFVKAYVPIAGVAMDTVLSGMSAWEAHNNGDSAGFLEAVQSVREGVDGVLPPKIAGIVKAAATAVGTMESHGLAGEQIEAILDVCRAEDRPCQPSDFHEFVKATNDTLDTWDPHAYRRFRQSIGFES